MTRDGNKIIAINRLEKATTKKRRSQQGTCGHMGGELAASHIDESKLHEPHDPCTVCNHSDTPAQNRYITIRLISAHDSRYAMDITNNITNDEDAQRRQHDHPNSSNDKPPLQPTTLAIKHRSTTEDHTHCTIHIINIKYYGSDGSGREKSSGMSKGGEVRRDPHRHAGKAPGINQTNFRKCLHETIRNYAKEFWKILRTPVPVGSGSLIVEAAHPSSPVILSPLPIRLGLSARTSQSGRQYGTTGGAHNRLNAEICPPWILCCRVLPLRGEPKAVHSLDGAYNMRVPGFCGLSGRPLVGNVMHRRGTPGAEGDKRPPYKNNSRWIPPEHSSTETPLSESPPRQSQSFTVRLGPENWLKQIAPYCENTVFREGTNRDNSFFAKTHMREPHFVVPRQSPELGPEQSPSENLFAPYRENTVISKENLYDEIILEKYRMREAHFGEHNYFRSNYATCETPFSRNPPRQSQELRPEDRDLPRNKQNTHENDLFPTHTTSHPDRCRVKVPCCIAEGATIDEIKRDSTTNERTNDENIYVTMRNEMHTRASHTQFFAYYTYSYPNYLLVPYRGCSSGRRNHRGTMATTLDDLHDNDRKDLQPTKHQFTITIRYDDTHRTQPAMDDEYLCLHDHNCGEKQITPYLVTPPQPQNGTKTTIAMSIECNNGHGAIPTVGSSLILKQQPRDIELDWGEIATCSTDELHEKMILLAIKRIELFRQYEPHEKTTLLHMEKSNLADNTKRPNYTDEMNYMESCLEMPATDILPESARKRLGVPLKTRLAV